MLPPLTRAWTVQRVYIPPNHSATVNSTNEYRTRRALLWQIKETIRTHWGWVVRGSVSSAGVGGMDGVDRWIVPDDVRWGRAGDLPVGWIVLRHVDAAGAGRHLDLLIHLQNASTESAAIASVYLSYAGFTGGTAAARPTAADEIAVISGTAWNATLAGEQPAYCVTSWATTDAAVARLAVTHYEASTGTVVTALFLSADRVESPVTGWTHPYVFTWLPGGATYANLYAPTTITTYGYDGGATPTARWFQGYWATESLPFAATAADDAALGQRNLLQTGNSLTQEGTLTSIALVSETPGKTGRHGTLPDVWYGRKSARTGDVLPPDGSATRVAIDDLVLPWDGSQTTRFA